MGGGGVTRWQRYAVRQKTPINISHTIIHNAQNTEYEAMQSIKGILHTMNIMLETKESKAFSVTDLGILLGTEVQRVARCVDNWFRDGG
jgi:predicted transcriptional regulator